MGQVPAILTEDVDSTGDAPLETMEQALRRAAAVADIFGVLEISGASAVGAATRLAVAEALAAGTKNAHVEVARCPARKGMEHSLRFAYSLRLGNSKAVAKACKLLHSEAREQGTSWLLPIFVQALELHGERPGATALSQISVTEWTIQSAAEVSQAELATVCRPCKESGDQPLLFTTCAAVPLCNYQELDGLSNTLYDDIVLSDDVLHVASI